MINTDLLSTGSTFAVGMANHLWQSTLFAAAAWLITIFLKKNHARIRYWIWFSVSIKFLIPFSLIVTLGGLIAPAWVKAPVGNSPEWDVIQTIHQPFSPQEPEAVSPTSDIINSSSPSDKAPLILLSLWLFGSFAVLLNWHKRGMRLSRMVRKAEPLIDGHTIKGFQRIRHENRIPDTVQLASTRDMMEPGVFGIFRPVLLLPAGMLRHVNDIELEAIFLHEFAHIRYKDNLIAFIHMLVEALFWFHPVVWWTGSRLVFERELACDESVLQSGKNPRVYAEGILKVCEHYFKSPLACASGVIGSNLKKRMEGIMKNQTGHKLSFVKKLFLSTAGLSILGIPLLIGIIDASPGQAQSANGTLNKPVIATYRSDASQVSGRQERNKESSEIINVKDHKNTSSAVNTVSMHEEGQNPPAYKAAGPDKAAEQASDYYRVKSDAVSTPQGKLSVKPTTENNKPAIVTVHTKIQTAKNPEKIIESVKAVLKTDLRTDAEDRVVLAQMESPKKVPSDAVDVSKNRDIKPETENAAAYTSRGVSCLMKGQIEDAISDFNKAIDLNPGNAAAYVSRGMAFHMQGKVDKAISDYNKAIEINPGFAAAYQNRGYAFYSKGKYEKAISDYDKAIELNPDNAATYNMRGIEYFRQGNSDKAISDYNKAIEINPRLAAAYKNRGYAFYSKGKYEKAISDYDKAIELNPDNAEIRYIRGNTNFKQGKYKKAISDYNRAIDLNPRFAAAYQNRGSAYYSIGKFQNAVSDYDKAIKLNPEAAVAKKFRKLALGAVSHYNIGYPPFYQQSSGQGGSDHIAQYEMAVARSQGIR